eukprot:TRINITY_DN640_c0_g1_i15.p1 TRINITY_DN640_c0_g1~~TRINITY_DN640_c0_g1_i15.p1  ORF type:complete len:281 (+),score=33.11 TRINITY_DN640_c0_g1_i15:199-1041(+)
MSRFSSSFKPQPNRSTAEIFALFHRTADAFAKCCSRTDMVEHNQRGLGYLLHTHQCLRDTTEKLPKRITKPAVKTVTNLLSDSSRLVCTTRTHTLTDACDKEIRFETLDSYGDKAPHMLMTQPTLDYPSALSASNEEAVSALLRICKGRPGPLGVVGHTVRNLTEGRIHNVESTWEHDYRRICENDSCIADGDEEACNSVRSILDTCLAFLQCKHTDLHSDTIFRALYVVAKLRMVPLRMLRDVWDLHDLQNTTDAVEIQEEAKCCTKTVVPITSATKVA